MNIITDTLKKVKKVQNEYGGLKERKKMLSEVGVQYPESICEHTEDSPQLDSPNVQ